ncbi:DsbA family protein [Lactobacillus xylocopicola]|uniref:DsbA family protein n=1 Tax=Lactobacillus xylocopicola TaxID=2976676 RepID=A0ABN6SIS1_9LACO|nr:DsbA family protein [Lactobacillus xylocopicola]BDR60217.1 DsbA family protein [Lactobacillus xylocopicola]
MFEIFIFVNPIGIYCYDTEVSIKTAIDDLDINSTLHFVPITNVSVIKEDIIRRKKERQRMKDLSQYTMASFQALRDYHAIKFIYGNKKARSYLLSFQQAVSRDFNHYTRNLARQVALNLDLDYDKIIDSKIKGYVDDSIQQDKNLARKFNVRNIPTTIIFNESGNYNGILLEGAVAHDKLITLLKNTGCIEPTAEDQEDSYSTISHLRLI